MIVAFMAILALFGSSVASVSPVTPPPTHYFSIIDAGSTGSRAYVFAVTATRQWVRRNYSLGDELSPKIALVDSKSVDTPLQSVEPSVFDVGQYLAPLLKFVQETVPEPRWEGAPLYLWATAGLRVIPLADAQQILDAVGRVLLTSPFLHPRDHVRLLSGADEAALAWVSVLHLEEKWPFFNLSPEMFSPACSAESLVCGEQAFDSSSLTNTGILEMGGASLQVLFPLSGDGSDSHLDGVRQSEKDRIFHVRVPNGAAIKVYAHSYLHYGMREAQSFYKQEYIDDMCHATRVRSSVDYGKCKETVHELFISQNRLTAGPVPGIVERLAALKASTKEGKGFDHMTVYAVENFLYTTNFFLESQEVLRDIDSKVLERLASSVRNFCKLNFEEAKRLHPEEIERRIKRACFAGSYIISIIEAIFGTNFPEGVLLKAASKIGGRSVGWPLGALVWSLTVSDSHIQWKEEGFDSITSPPPTDELDEPVEKDGKTYFSRPEEFPYPIAMPIDNR